MNRFNFDPYSAAKKIERDNYQFKVVTQISTEDVMRFYCSLARFPTNEEIEIIKVAGMEAFLQVVQMSKMPPLPELKHPTK